MPDEFDVFLSHNSRDKPIVEEIAVRLRDRGLRVWLDNPARRSAGSGGDGRGRPISAQALSSARETRVGLLAEHAGSAPEPFFCYAGRDSCTYTLEKK